MGGKFNKSEKPGISNQTTESGLLHSNLGVFFRICSGLVLVASKKDNRIIELNKGNYTWPHSSKKNIGCDVRQNWS